MFSQGKMYHCFVHTRVLFKKCNSNLKPEFLLSLKERLLERVHVYEPMPGIFLFSSYRYSAHRHHAKYIKLPSPNHPTIFPDLQDQMSQKVFFAIHMNRFHTLRYIPVSIMYLFANADFSLLCLVWRSKFEMHLIFV